MALRVGDCIATLFDDGGVESVPVVPCSEPHEGEVFAVVEVSLDSFPGREEMSDLAETRCIGRLFEDDVGVSYDDSVYLATSLSPTKETWDGLDDREITCIAASPGVPLTESIRGTKRETPLR